MSKFPMTVQDTHALEEEVKHLKGILRPQINQAITGARRLGDLKKNTEYHAAHGQQGMVEARIRDIEAKLSNVRVVNVTAVPHSGKMIFGATVDVADVKTDETVTYQIIGDDEVDIKSDKISMNSLIVHTLVGKTKGDAVLMRTPGGDVECEIVGVHYT